MAVSIQINGISVAYGHKRVLSNIYLKIEPGYIHGLIGPNGAGKSTLFKCILGQVKPSAGEVILLGEPAKNNLEKIAYVPQKDDIDWQFPTTVLDVVMMGRYPYKKWYQFMNKKDKTMALDAIEQIGMSEFIHRQIGELSGGQQQRVFIARALCQDSVHHDLESVQHYFNRVILINQRLIGYGDTNVVFTKENIGKTFSSQSHLIQQHF